MSRAGHIKKYSSIPFGVLLSKSKSLAEFAARRRQKDF